MSLHLSRRLPDDVTASQGGPITENWLCRQLRRFDIDSRNIRIDDRQAKGYELSDFQDAFARFLADPASDT